MISPSWGAGWRTRALFRGVVIAFGVSAVLWGATQFRSDVRQAAIERIADRIAAGESFNLKVLQGEVLKVQDFESSAHCHPALLRSAAIVKLRIAELQSASDLEHSEDLKALQSAAVASLSCAPADPFLWLALYWISDVQGRSGSAVELLRLSYKSGPNEGWIAVKRNALAFKNFRELPSDLAQDAIAEFAKLVNADLYQRAAEIFLGPASAERQQILQEVARAAPSKVHWFLRQVEQQARSNSQ
jgi:hypothetical protein